MVTLSDVIIPRSVTDLSIGGAGFETVYELPTNLDLFTLLVTEPNFHIRVQCEARGIRELWRKRVIHAQFVGADQTGSVEDALHQIQATSSVLPFPIATGGHGNVVNWLFKPRRNVA